MTYITPHKVFSHLDRLHQWGIGEKPAPVTVEFDLSNACSLRCFGCHMAYTHVAGPWAVRDRNKPEGYTETGMFADSVMVKRALAEMAGAGVQAVVWSGGGEPTLHPHVVDIFRSAASVGLQQGMYTLGGHVTPELAEACRAFSWVVVSLDAPTEQTYAREKGVPVARFHAACEGVRRLSETVPVVGVSYLLHGENWDQLDAMIALARELGATYTTFRPTIETSPAAPSLCIIDRGWVTRAMPELERVAALPDVECDPARFAEYRDWTGHGYKACYGIRLVTMVTPDGRVWVCPNRRGVPGSEIGDLSRESFAEVWARHPSQWTEFGNCRVMCRLHQVNRALVSVYTRRPHEAFV